MSEPTIPQASDEQDPQAIDGDEIAQEELEDVAGGSNNNCNGFCPSQV